MAQKIDNSQEWWNSLTKIGKCKAFFKYAGKSIEFDQLKYLYKWQIEEMYKEYVKL